MAESENIFVQPGGVEVAAWNRDSFLEELARRYHGSPVHITTVGPLPGEVNDCRLQNILSTVDEIVFSMECESDSETRYVVVNPERLISKRNRAGATEGLEIVSLDGSVTHVWFGDAARSRADVAA